MIPFSYELAKALEKDNLRRAAAGYLASEANARKRRIHRKQKSAGGLSRGALR